MQFNTQERPGRRGAAARALTGIVAVLLAGCASAPPLRAVAAVAAPAAASAPGPAPVRSNPSGSSPELRVLVFRSGSAARVAGHNHVLLAGDLKVSRESGGPLLRFRLDALVLDPPALRERMGPAFASRIDTDGVAATRINMLKSLEAEAHPEVVVRSLQQVGEGPSRAVEIEVLLHGQTRRQWIAVEVRDGRAQGRVVLKQSDFGITPYSVLGGLLAVQDALVVEFQLEAGPSD